MALLALGLLHLAPAPPRSLFFGSHPMHAARAAVSAVRQRSCHCCASATRSARAIDLAERHCSPEPARFAALRDETAQRWPGGAHMVSGAQQGRLLHMLVRLSRASRVLEVGCFSGYAAMWMGLALPAGGKLLSLERDERAAAVARAHLASAGLSDRVEVRLGDAMDALEALPGPFELIVISAEALQVAPSAEAVMRSVFANLASHGLVIIVAIIVAQPATVSEGPTIHEQAREEDARGALMPMLLSLARQVEPAAHAVTLPSPDGDGRVLTLIGRTLEM